MQTFICKWTLLTQISRTALLLHHTAQEHAPLPVGCCARILSYTLSHSLMAAQRTCPGRNLFPLRQQILIQEQEVVFLSDQACYLLLGPRELEHFFFLHSMSDSLLPQNSASQWIPMQFYRTRWINPVTLLKVLAQEFGRTQSRPNLNQYYLLWLNIFPGFYNVLSSYLAMTFLTVAHWQSLSLWAPGSSKRSPDAWTERFQA